jgi:hypothetical protein
MCRWLRVWRLMRKLVVLSQYLVRYGCHLRAGMFHTVGTDRRYSRYVYGGSGRERWYMCVQYGRRIYSQRWSRHTHHHVHQWCVVRITDVYRSGTDKQRKDNQRQMGNQSESV